MAEYMNKEVFLSSMGLTGDETKYGNRDAEHQHRSYSTYMSYEIMDSVEDSIVEEELAPVRHGRWVLDEYARYFSCSACGTQFDDETDTYCNIMNGFAPNYCEDCGAKMEVEVSL